ncbi:aminotransferase class V-fold PLP-dependent enzyme [Erysipelothrix sp. strain 2 (EsS2-7-Brazil)]|uniref:pyridoxal phosphate-dependent decarboxylase family protein n=1 Tax=Erysipelothrix sp. strain 2 (EsS2-7-Brazil) TaxID=2500579 RepID=UPI00190ADD73|nr:aminotransferase class V-fold PLP-dependent enzyme [Erysipelothrix sp. strain 2 (EsS2-7-Brazil)]MBK2403793.1 aminotransferase class V-fold PLP-dependent enzyme [Erysipelothrix sp. strain 2 (EsS2-7-Brazil)]
MKRYELDEDASIEAMMIEFIKTFYQGETNPGTGPVCTIAPEDVLDRLKNQDMPQQGRDLNSVVSQLMTDIYPYSLRSAHPRHFGFIPGPATKVSVLGDLMSSAYNVHASNWVNSSAASTIEENTICWLTKQIGYDEHAGGLFVSGGSMANLTGLIAARDKVLNEDNRHLGVIYLSDQTHHSVEKGLKIIGFTSRQFRFIDTDEAFQIKTDILERTILEDLNQGLVPCCVVATAGTTNTGTVDPLDDIGDLCKKYSLWMHVDGAYGASFLLSTSQVHRLKGIHKADSVSWDAHKLLYQTYSCAMILVKDKQDLLNSFDASPEYLKDIDGDRVTNFGSMGIELTRPTRALKLWLSLQTIGIEEYSRRIDHGQELANYVQERILKYNHWEMISPAQFSIINFRYIHPDLTDEALDSLNTYLAKQIVADEFAGIFTTELKGHTVLRMCTINPITTFDDLDETLDHLETLATHYLNTNL